MGKNGHKKRKYTEKMVSAIKNGLNYGDYSKIANTLGYSRETVRKVMANAHYNEDIIDAAKVVSDTNKSRKEEQLAELRSEA